MPTLADTVSVSSFVAGSANPTRVVCSANPTHVAGSANPTRVVCSANPTHVAGSANPKRVVCSANPTHVVGPANSIHSGSLGWLILNGSVLNATIILYRVAAVPCSEYAIARIPPKIAFSIAFTRVIIVFLCQFWCCKCTSPCLLIVFIQII